LVNGCKVDQMVVERYWYCFKCIKIWTKSQITVLQLFILKPFTLQLNSLQF